MRNNTYNAIALALAFAALSPGQPSRPDSRGIVHNSGQNGPVVAGGPFREGTRFIPPPSTQDQGEDGDPGTPTRKLYPPATPRMAGESFVDALEQLGRSAGDILHLPWAESLFGVTNVPSPGPRPQSAVMNFAARTPGLTTFWSNGSPSNNNIDPQVAASSWAVGVLTWDTLVFYDKSGTLLPSTPTFPNPTNTETLFGPLVQVLDANLNLNPKVAGPAFLFANGQVGDARLEFDKFRKRWVVLASAKNNGSLTGAFSTLLIRSQRRTKLLLAVSIDEDPSHGFYTYWFNATPDDGACNALTDSSPCPGSNFRPGDGSDYPSLGMSSRHYLLSIGAGHQPLDGSQQTETWAYLIAANADDISSGLNKPRTHGFKQWDIGNGETADGITQAVVSSQAMAPIDWGLVVSVTKDRLILTGVPPIDPPSLTTTSWTMPDLTPLAKWPEKGSNLGVNYANLTNAPIKAQQIAGILSTTWNDCRNWTPSQAACSPSVHLFTAQVNFFPFVFSQIDRVFGLRNVLDDAPTDVVGYGMPGVTMNQNKDIAVVYSRSSPLLFPEVRYSTWLHGEPDIRPSAILRVGDGPFPCSLGPKCGAPMTYDTAGIALDPFDQTGVWMAHIYATATGAPGLTVGKVFGAVHPGLMVSAISFTPTTVQAGSQLQVTYTVSNYGDGAANPAHADIILEPLSSGGPAILLGTDPLPVMGPGNVLQRQITLTVTSAPKGVHQLRIQANVGDVSQYTQGVNFALASQFLTIQ